MSAFDPERIEAVHRLEAALGPEAHLHVVGGAVRDHWLGRPTGDWDLATALRPEDVLSKSSTQGFRVIPTGLQHGTVTVLVGACSFEVTTFRGDGTYVDGRRPENVRLGVSLEEDLARRDFTINAMALPVRALANPSDTDLVDPFGGRQDLRDGLIRAVGDPLVRFGEDGLRPLRACRFLAQLGFRMDPETERAIPRTLEVARRVAVERVFTELTKLLVAPFAAEGLRALARTGLLDLWMAELRPMEGCVQGPPHRWDVWDHTLALGDHMPSQPSFRWAALLHDAGKPYRRTVEEDGRIRFLGHEAVSLDLARAILGRLKAPKSLQTHVLALIRHHGTHPDLTWSDGACRRFLARLAEDDLPLADWATFRRADRLAKGGDPVLEETQHAAIVARLETLARARSPLKATELALDGRALMALAGRPGGPWLGDLQRHLLDAVIEDPDRNDPDRLADVARAWLESHSR